MKNRTADWIARWIRTPLIGSMSMLMLISHLQAEEVITTTSGCPDANNGGITVDLEVTTDCQVSAGAYTYRNVNIFRGGKLEFLDQDIQFHAQNILIKTTEA